MVIAYAALGFLTDAYESASTFVHHHSFAVAVAVFAWLAIWSTNDRIRSLERRIEHLADDMGATRDSLNASQDRICDKVCDLSSSLGRNLDKDRSDVDEVR